MQLLSSLLCSMEAVNRTNVRVWMTVWTSVRVQSAGSRVYTGVPVQNGVRGQVQVRVR